LGSAVRHVDRETSKRGLFVFLAHIRAGLAHGFDTGIQRDKVIAIAA
jgi:hypothetical protein